MLVCFYGLPLEKPHVRYNPLKDEWLLVSPHRTQRPWQGKVEKPTEKEVPEHDPRNPLCPRATRSNGLVNPDYVSTFAFDNDFPALLDDGQEGDEGKVLGHRDVQAQGAEVTANSLFRAAAVTGKCRVICFHPKSNLTLPLMTATEIVKVVDTWIEEAILLGTSFNWVQIFENKGELMGCSNAHPHCQIWASSYLPNEIRVEHKCQLDYYQKNKSNMLMDYVHAELVNEQNDVENRVVVQNDQWLALVPYWAFWPYEILLLPKKYVSRLQEITADQKQALAEIMKLLTVKYDNLFQTSFPYSMGWHGKRPI